MCLSVGGVDQMSVSVIAKSRVASRASWLRVAARLAGRAWRGSSQYNCSLGVRQAFLVALWLWWSYDSV